MDKPSTPWRMHTVHVQSTLCQKDHIRQVMDVDNISMNDSPSHFESHLIDDSFIPVANKLIE